MRRCTVVASGGCLRCAASRSPVVVVVVVGAWQPTRQQQQRDITSRGQFNPIHNFTYGMEHGVRARDEKAFERLITNPGPLRIAYTPDYLDWLYRCYRAKCTYVDARTAAEKKFKGNVISSEAALAGPTSGDAGNRLPGAPPPGMFLRPPHSFRRLAGEAKRRHAQETLDEVSKAQGLLDLFERQPQFPVIHIDRCTRFHLVELFKEMVLDRSLEATAIWDKALMYRAILSERKSSYPISFRYIFEAVDDTVFASVAEAAEAAGAAGGTSKDLDSSSHPLVAKCPTMEAYYYFLYLVKKYYVDNAVEAHVVLRCHREANAAELLFSNPPPKDDVEVQQTINALRSSETDRTEVTTATNTSGTAGAAASSSSFSESHGGGSAVVSAETRRKAFRRLVPPSSYPPIETLWRCEENVPLLKVLLFGEFNLIVSENPFVKFPSAHGFLVRPYSSDASRGSVEGVSLASVISEKRGHWLLPSLPRNVANAIDARAQELRRLQQKHHRDDIVSFQKLLRSTHAEDNPSTFSSYADWSYFNPRAVRAEERDRLTRKGLDALKLYDLSREDIYRCSFDDVMASSTKRLTEVGRMMPPYLPTLPHFVSIIKKDAHISFLVHVGLPDRRSSSEATAKHAELERRIFYLAQALYHTALHYCKESLRRVNRQKVNVAASLLDDFVEQEWAAMLREGEVSDITPTSIKSQDGITHMARRLGRYMPFARRSLDESGFPTDARADDYTRLMAAPAVVKGIA